MINHQLLNPKSIVIAGGSNDVHKPGGKILKNIIDGGYQGRLYVFNPKESEIQGIRSYQTLEELPEVELAIIAIAAKWVPDLISQLITMKNTRAFIVLSAGFSEESEEGKRLEEQIVELVDSVDGALIGPNCIGVLTPAYHGIFTLPIPRLDPKGCDFVSGSGATACFIMENGIPKGLSFARVFSVGNSAQLGVEDILQYMDVTFDPSLSPKVKLLYLESISEPARLLRHASSLIRKGCRIAAIKAGSSEAGSRAASSHTGALANSDMAVDALFAKAGIIRCKGREELINVASVLLHKPLEGRNFAVITHAGGPAVMLTDALSKAGFNVPKITSPKATELLEKLFPGSSVANPIDFLATGTASQLGEIIEYTDSYFDEVDAMAVIFGTPGLVDISDVYKVLDHKMSTSRKPIFPILPSVVTAEREVKEFLEKGHVNFPDEVLFAEALSLVYHNGSPQHNTDHLEGLFGEAIRKVIDRSPSGYLDPEGVQTIMDAAGIDRVPEAVATSAAQALNRAETFGYPVVMKVVGPLHKTDVGGVSLNIDTGQRTEETYRKLMQIEGAQGVLVQPMISGLELFAGAKFEPKFGHIILCGMGGILIEVMKDFSTGLSPLSKDMASKMIKSLKSYPLLEGYRGKSGIDTGKFNDVLLRLSALLHIAPEIQEMDINPLIGNENGLFAVDARIRIAK